jgi:hypothetical protein
LALRITHSGDKNTYLIHDSEFFATPIWQSRPLPIEVIKKNTENYQNWKNDVKALTADAILLGTEAGIDILLFWDKETYKLFWPAESP